MRREKLLLVTAMLEMVAAAACFYFTDLSIELIVGLLALASIQLLAWLFLYLRFRYLMRRVMQEKSRRRQTDPEPGAAAATAAPQPPLRFEPIVPPDILSPLPARGPNIDSDVRFTAFRPSSVRPETWYSLLVFMHKGGSYTNTVGQVVDPNKQVEAKAKSVLGPALSFYGQVSSDSSSPVRRGSELLFKPWLEVGEMNPSDATLGWREPVHSIEFRFLIPASADGSMVRGGVQIFSEYLLIGELHFSMNVTSGAPLAGGPSVRTEAVMYRKIFASYSHSDIAFVGSLIRYVETLGDRYLIDVRKLRSGVVWSKRLEEMIQDADIFQLFWSRNSM
jgi:hypothetical protein